MARTLSVFNTLVVDLKDKKLFNQYFNSTIDEEKDIEKVLLGMIFSKNTNEEMYRKACEKVKEIPIYILKGCLMTC